MDTVYDRAVIMALRCIPILLGDFQWWKQDTAHYTTVVGAVGHDAALGQPGWLGRPISSSRYPRQSSMLAASAGKTAAARAQPAADHFAELH